MSRVTASKVGLLAYCQAFARDDMPWSDLAGPSAERGTRFHAAIEAYTGTRERAEDTAIEDDIREPYRHACAWVDALGDVSLRTEVAFGWDPEHDEARVLRSSGARDYSDGAGLLCGTADLIQIIYEAGRPVSLRIWDWKTGDGSGAGPQLRALALMAARTFRVESVTVAALEARDAGVFEVAREELDAFALDAVAGELAEQLAAIPTAEPVPGSHCGELYCPARLSCPLGNAATAQVIDVIPADALVSRRDFRLTDPIETAEHAAWAVDVIRLVGAKLDAIKDEIKAKLPPGGWQLGDGRVLREGTCDTKAFDKHKALALIKQLGATPEQIASLNYTFAKSTGLRVVGGGAKPRTKRSRAA